MNDLKNGDWVRTDKGEVGKVVLISERDQRAYVDQVQHRIGAALISFPVASLTKIDPPSDQDPPTVPHK